MFLIGFQGSRKRTSVWIVGSSIIRNAFSYARTTYDGPSLGLKSRNCSVWWQGKGGMRWDQLVPKMEQLLALKYEKSPDILILHCGGNNLGYCKLHKLRRKIRSTLKILQKMLPSCRIVWSQILPRQSWRASTNTFALNQAATRINNLAGCKCIELGGGFIKYPEIGWNERGLFVGDGVHLSDMGNSIMLYRLQQFLQDFV